MRILFTPMPLIDCQKLWHLKQRGIFEIVEDNPDFVFRWEYANTIFLWTEDIWGVPLINGSCMDVSKVMVDYVYHQIYGHSTEAITGQAVEKNNMMNGLKDVRMVNLDHHQRREGYFYQQVLTDQEEYTETRLMIMSGHEVYRILKHKSGIPGKVLEYEIVTPAKDDRITAYCNYIGLDYGEIDMIGDVIIDVNPTPGDAAFYNMPPRMSYRFIEDYCELFKIHYDA